MDLGSQSNAGESMITLIWPWILLLAPLPLIFRLIRRPMPLQTPALRSTFLSKIANKNLSIKRRSWRKWLILLLLYLCWLCAIVALSRPVWFGQPMELPTSGRDILLAVDISGSMEQDDMNINGRSVSRLEAVKSVVGDFVLKRKGDRLGLILYGERAYLQTPLSFDRKTMELLLNEAQIGFAGQGTAIGDAIGLAIKRLQDRPANNRVLILLTDGSNNAGEINPLKAAQLAAKAKVKIHTIGIGAEKQEEWGLFGKRIVNPSADLDEETLSIIADTTGGNYFRARNPSELSTIYDYLNEIEPIEQELETIRPTLALYHWPLSAAFCFAIIATFISNKFRVYE